MTVSETVTITLPLQPTMRAMVRMELTKTKTVSETVKIMLLLQPTMRATERMELTSKGERGWLLRSLWQTPGSTDHRGPGGIPTSTRPGPRRRSRGQGGGGGCDRAAGTNIDVLLSPASTDVIVLNSPRDSRVLMSQRLKNFVVSECWSLHQLTVPD